MYRNLILALIVGSPAMLVALSPATAGETLGSQASASAAGKKGARKANCNKFKMKALRTGRHIWWARYQKCLHKARK